MDQQEKLEMFMAVTQMQDVAYCTHLLEAHQWDVEAAVNSALGSGDALVAESVPAPMLRSPSRAVPSRSAPPRPTSAVNANPRVPVILNIPISLLRLVSHVLGGALGLGTQVVSGIFRVILPSRFHRSVTNTVRALTSGAVPEDHKESAESFINAFESTYGAHHPPFERSSSNDAIKKGQRDFKFVFVYLHSPEHQDTPGFCSDVLCSAPVVDFLRENFVCWGGDIRNSDAFQLSVSLRASTYPYIAVLSSTNSRVELFAQVEGTCSQDSLIGVLTNVIEDQGARLVVARADQEERDTNRMIREEQDREYEESLAADREREAARAAEEQRIADEKRKAEEEAARVAAEAAAAEQREVDRQVALQRRREEKAQVLGEEPPAGPGITQVVVKLPDGARHQRRFNSSAKVSNVYDFVGSLEGVPFEKYHLLSNFPRKVYDDDTLQRTLEEVGMHPQAMLFLQEAE